MSFLSPSTPSPPPPPPPPPNPPTLASSQLSATAAQQAAAAAAGQGFNDTIKTSSLGASSPDTAKKTLLGQG